MTETPPGSFAEYAARVREFGRRWFMEDAAAKSQLNRDPARRAEALRLAAKGRMVGTDILYQLQPGRWAAERLQIQKAIIDAVSGTTEDPDMDRRDADLPIAVLLLGLPGSGKSIGLKPIAVELIARMSTTLQLVVDADTVRSSLPEYSEGLGSEVVQVETAFLTYERLVERVIARRCDLIVDMVGDPEHSVRDLEYFTAAGLTVACLCASVDVEVAVQRAQLRAIETGRYVPPEYIRDVGTRPIEAYHAVVEAGVPLLGAALLDTSGRPLGPPFVEHTNDVALFGEVGEPTKLWPTSAGSTTEAEHV